MKKIKFETPEPFGVLIDSDFREIIEDSGRSSGKTTTNEQVAIMTAIRKSNNNVWYVCANESDISTTILASLKSTIEDLGLEQHFRYKDKTRQLICSNGSVIYFGGINGRTVDDTTRTKGFTPNKKRLALAICDEANKANSPLHLDGFKTTADKFLVDGAKIIWAFNKHPNKTHWSHKYFADRIRAGAYHLYSTWEDIETLLKPATVREILKMKENDPLFYRYWYLGEMINFEGMIYPQFDRTRNCIDIVNLIATGDYIKELILGVDEGTVNDSTSVCPLAIMASGKAVVIDCFENKPSREGQDSPSTQSKKIAEWFTKLCGKFYNLKNVPRVWNFESAEGGQSLMRQFREDTGEPCGIVRNKSVWGDIKRVRTMLSDGVLYFHTAANVTTEILMQDIEGYIVDPRTNDIKSGQREDTIDALEYATKLYYDRPIIVR